MEEDAGVIERVTLVGIEKGENMKEGDRRKVLWAWSGEEGGDKRVIEVR